MAIMNCPGREELYDYSLGRLSNADSESVSSHVESCPDCQAQLRTLEDRGDSLLGRLRAPCEESYLDEPQFRAAVTGALAMPERLPPWGDDPPPRVLGEYELLEELGRGGMGRVYKARHTKLDRVVALKILPSGRLEDARAVARFEREMRAIGRLDHPHVVHAHDAREIDGVPVLIMEYVEGMDLGELVRRLGPLEIAQACELVRQAALGLQYAHEHGLVHRDVKPSNLMLARSGEVKLLDLGLARFQADPAGEEMTGAGQMMGTADYVAPEQVGDSRAADIRADIYGLGCALYKLLAGRAPYSGPAYRGALDKMNAHVRDPIPPIEQFAPDLPAGLTAVLDRMLAKDPAARYAAPSEAAEALTPFAAGADTSQLVEAALAADPPAAERPAPPQPAPQPRRWRPWQWLTAVGLVLLLMAAAFAAGVMVTIHKNGETTQVEVPEGSKVRVAADGGVDVTLPEDEMAAARARVREAMRDQEKLQGRWSVVSMNFSGKEASRKFVEDMEWVFENDQLRQKGDTSALRYTLYAGSDPKQIDFYEEGVDNIIALAGIYRFRGDRLEIAYGEGPAYRPKDFAPGRDKTVVVLERIGQEAPAEKAAPGEAEPNMQAGVGGAESGRQKIEGRWTFLSIINEGGLSYSKDYPANVPQPWIFAADGSFRGGTRPLGGNLARYEIDPSTTPKTITFSQAGGKPLWRGIYHFRNGRLEVALSRTTPRRPGGEAPEPPKNFRDGRDKIVVVLERSGQEPPAVGEKEPPTRDKSAGGAASPWGPAETTLLDVAVDADGAVTVDGRPRTVAALVGMVEAQSRERPLKVRLRLASDAPYRQVVELIERLRKAGADHIQVTPTEKPPEDKPTVGEKIPELPRATPRPLDEKAESAEPEKPSGDEPADAESAQQKLEGRWDVVSLNEFGKKIPEKAGERLQWVFENGRLRWERNGVARRRPWRELPGSLAPKFQLDPSTTPKSIDLIGPQLGMGIYQFKDGQLEIALSIAPPYPGSRPADFTPARQKIVALLKPSAKTTFSDAEAIQGQWDATSFHQNGTAAPEKTTKSLQWLFKDESVAWSLGGRQSDFYRYRLNDWAHPKTIDLLEDGKVRYRGIYRLTGPNLDLAFTAASSQPGDFVPGPSRPGGFSPRPGTAVAQLAVHYELPFSGAESLRGRWDSYWFKQDGTSLPTSRQWLFDEGRTVRLLGGRQSAHYGYRLNDSTIPKSIDFLQDGKVRYRGIYDFNGGRFLHIALSATPTRPTDFTPGPGKAIAYLGLHYESDAEAIQGRWKVASVKNSDAALQQNSSPFWEFAEESLKWSEDGAGRDATFRYRIDPSSNPRRIDLFKDDEIYARGIYRLRNHRLEIAYSSVVSDKSPARPEDFDPDPGETVVVLEHAPADAEPPEPKEPPE